VDRNGNAALLGSFSSPLYQDRVVPTIVGQYLVISETYYNYLYVYDSVKKTLSTSFSTCSASIGNAPVVYGTKFVLICSGSCSVAANILDLAALTLDTATITTPSCTSGVGATVAGSMLVIATSSSVISAYDLSKSPVKLSWTIATNTIFYVVSAPVEWNGNVYFAGVPYATTGVTTTAVFKMSPTSGATSTVGSLKWNTDSGIGTKRLVIRSGGVFGGGIMYVIGSSNITAYTTSWDVMFNYKHNTSIQSVNQLNPDVLAGSGAVVFYDNDNYFNVVGGFKGGLAWQYPASTYSNYDAILTDNASVFFKTSAAVVGADIFSGAVRSLTSYGSTSVRGFAVVPGVNVTTVVSAMTNQLLVASPVGVVRNSNPYFPGSGSAPSGTGSFGEESKSKAWIAGVVIGVLVVIAVVVFIAKKNGSSSGSDDNYVPMNPSTQV
jgi:hypothetical protein